MEKVTKLSVKANEGYIYFVTSVRKQSPKKTKEN